MGGYFADIDIPEQSTRVVGALHECTGYQAWKVLHTDLIFAALHIRTVGSAIPNYGCPVVVSYCHVRLQFVALAGSRNDGLV